MPRKPKSGETQSDYIEYCVSDPKMKQEFPDVKQRLAVCYDKYREG